MNAPFTVTGWVNKIGDERAFQRDMTINELAELIESAPPVSEKKGLDAPLVKLAAFGDEANPESGCLREDANVTMVTGIEGDDDSGKHTAQEVFADLVVAGVECIVTTTATSEPGAERLRIMCPLRTPITGTPESMQAKREARVHRLEKIIGYKLGRESYNLSMSYFYSSLKGKPPLTVLVNEGALRMDEVKLLKAGAKKSVTQKVSKATKAAPKVAPAPAPARTARPVPIPVVAEPPPVVHAVGVVPEFMNDCPPCMRAIIEEQHFEKERIANNFTLEVGKYLKRKFPDAWPERLEQFNQEVFRDKPMPHKDIHTLIGSLRKDKPTTTVYRCTTDTSPIKSHCNRTLCETMKYGVTTKQHRPYKVEVIKTDPHATVIGILDALDSGLMEDSGLVVTGGTFAEVVETSRKGADGIDVLALEFQRLSPVAMRALLQEHVAFTAKKMQTDADTGGSEFVTVATKCPSEQVDELMSRKSVMLKRPRQCIGISGTPILYNGELTGADGYDPHSQLYLYGVGSLDLPEHISQDDALAAATYLQSWFDEFPAATPEDMDRMMALAMTAALRSSLSHAPLFAINKHAYGDGGSTLMSFAGVIQTGRIPPVLTLQAGDGATEEMDKGVTGIQLACGMTLAFDNWPEGLPVGSGVLPTVITEPTRMARPLGRSEVTEVVNGQFCMLNGVNLAINADMIRRTVVIELDSKQARPELRNFKRPLLLQDASRERTKILRAPYTMVMAYLRSGARSEVAQRNGFDPWRNLIARTLRWLGRSDVCITRDDLLADDPLQSALARLLPAWAEFCRLAGYPYGVPLAWILTPTKVHADSASALYKALAAQSAIIRDVLAEHTYAKSYNGEWQLDKVKCGIKLAGWTKRISHAHNLRLVRGAELIDNVAAYRVERLPGAAPVDPPAPPVNVVTITPAKATGTRKGKSGSKTKPKTNGNGHAASDSARLAKAIKKYPHLPPLEALEMLDADDVPGGM